MRRCLDLISSLWDHDLRKGPFSSPKNTGLWFSHGLWSSFFNAVIYLPALVFSVIFIWNRLHHIPHASLPRHPITLGTLNPHRRSALPDLTAVASPDSQLAWPISIIDQPLLIQQLLRNLVWISARTLSAQEHARKVVFSCYVSHSKANCVKFPNISYNLNDAWETTYHLRNPLPHFHVFLFPTIWFPSSISWLHPCDKILVSHHSC